MLGLGATELIVILIIVLIIFGASRLPEIGSGMGKGIRNFRDSMRDGEKGISPGEEGEDEATKGPDSTKTG